MYFKIYFIAVIVLATVFLCNMISIGTAKINHINNTFVDSKRGISFHIPDDWHIASKKTSQEYNNLLFGNTASLNSLSNNASSGALKPLAIVLPKSMNGASFVVFSETLPFPISIDKYFNNTKNQLKKSGIPVGNATRVTIGNLKGVVLNGLKYNIILPNYLSQSQILFIKDTNGFIVGFITGLTDQTKNMTDINSIISSLTFKSKHQNNIVNNTNIATTTGNMSNINDSNSNSKNITTTSN